MDERFFIKTSTAKADLTIEQKIQLNRRANELFNSGNIELAAKIFVTTGYSDGLTRVGDYFYEKEQKLVALKYYKLANNEKNVEILVKDLANIVRMMMD